MSATTEAFTSAGIQSDDDLVHAEVLTEARALKIVAAIQRANPTHITAALIDRFRTCLKER